MSVTDLRDAFGNPLSVSRQLVIAIARMMLTPSKNDLTRDYYDDCLFACGYLNLSTIMYPDDAAYDNFTSTAYTDQQTAVAAQSYERNIVNAALGMRNELFTLIDQVNAFSTKARNDGYLPPTNPFFVIQSLCVPYAGEDPADVMQNLINGYALSEPAAHNITENIDAYLVLLNAEATGAIDIDKHVISNDPAQLSSITMSLEGFSQTGDPEATLSTMLPDADQIVQQKADQTLSVLDFSKRVPHVLFTADYAPAGKTIGSIVAWKKIADAAGYVVKRHSVFNLDDTSIELSNFDVASQYASIRDYVRTWLLTFYDIDESSICAYLDKDVLKDDYYFYRISGYQIQKDPSTSLFDSSYVAVRLAGSRTKKLLNDMAVLASFGNASRTSDKPGAQQPLSTSYDFLLPFASDDVSPYPFIAQELFGDSGYDWLLAGLNVKASKDRSEENLNTRQYSYLNASIYWLIDRMNHDTFVVPNDLDFSSVVKNINDAIATYGVTQVIQDLLSETGILYYFDGLEGNVNSNFQLVGSQNIEDSGILSTVVAAIDPESMTLDLKTLSSNLSTLLSGQAYAMSDKSTDKLASGVKSPQSSPSELEIPSNDMTSDPSDAESDVQFVQTLSSLGTDVVDLTTYNGISTLMRVLRIFSDFGPGKEIRLMSRIQQQASSGAMSQQQIDDITNSINIYYATATSTPSAENSPSATPADTTPVATVTPASTGTSNDTGNTHVQTTSPGNKNNRNK